MYTNPFQKRSSSRVDRRSKDVEILQKFLLAAKISAETFVLLKGCYEYFEWSSFEGLSSLDRFIEKEKFFFNYSYGQF